jgi:signal transduction histidine kinase
MDERPVMPAAAQLELAALDKTNWDAALEAILRIDSGALGVDRTSFWSVTSDPAGILCELGYIASADAIERGALLRATDAASYTRELDRARILPMDDIEHDTRAAELVEYCRARHIGAMLDVPVCVDGELTGVLCHEHVGGPRHWTQSEIELAMTAGAAVAGALEARRRVRAEAGERRARFLAEASHCVARDLDEAACARRAVDALLPEMADWAVLDMFEGGAVRRAAMAHADPGKQAIVDDYLRRFPPEANAPHVTVLAHRLGEAVLVPEITDQRMRGVGFSEAQMEAVHHLGARSLILVPFANCIVDGVIMMVVSRRAYNADDLALAERYRDRVCGALTNARLYQRSQAALRARDDFLRMASHELRTPLTALRVACERLRTSTQGAPPEAVTTAERALRASRRLSRLVTHMLDAVELKQQRPIVVRGRVDLVPVVREAVDDLLAASRAGATVELALPDALVGQFDEDRVCEILTNLVDNALRYSGGQPVRVELARDGGDAVLSVADRGPGLALEVLARLYEPYEYGTQANGGLGLGLFIVKQLVDAQGGCINVHSGAAGATFTVRLPGMDD